MKNGVKKKRGKAYEKHVMPSKGVVRKYLYHECVGRPSKLTPLLIDRIEDLIESGAYLETIAMAVGVQKDSFFNWSDVAQHIISRSSKERLELTEHEKLCLEFFYRCKTKESQVEMQSVENVRAGGPGWQSQAWFLERKFFNRWGRKDFIKQEINQTVTTNEISVEDILAELDLDTRRKYLEAARRVKLKKEAIEVNGEMKQLQYAKVD